MTLAPYWHKKTGKFRYSVSMWNAQERRTVRLGHFDSITEAEAVEDTYRAAHPLRYPQGRRVMSEGIHYLVNEETGCWEWIRKTTPLGYGYCKNPLSKRLEPAHRVMYELTHGRPIATGMQIDHLCRNRRCVNPSHLEPVTPKENIRRGWEARSSKAK